MTLLGKKCHPVEVEQLSEGVEEDVFFFSRWRVASLTGAKDSSDLPIHTAPLKSPSSNLEATRVARFFKGSPAVSNCWCIASAGIL